MARNRYYLSVADLAHARGADNRFSYDGAGPHDFAAALQQALRTDGLFQRWRAAQPDPDAVDAGLGATDPAEAEEGTVRKRFASSKGENAVHGSDSVENGRNEIAFFFAERELVGA